MTEKKYPRVLVIGAASLGMHDATGITLVNLFAGWPQECIAQIYDSDFPPAHDICVNYRRFSGSEIGLVKFAKSLVLKLKMLFSFLRTKGAHQPINTTSEPTLSGSLLAAYSDVIPFQLPKNIIDWVDHYKPDLIYSVLGSVRMMNVVLSIAEKHTIPIVPHFMDDWPNTMYAQSTAYLIPRLILDRKLKKILSKASFGLTICEEMASEYTDRYDLDFDFFMNCVDCTAYNIDYMLAKDVSVKNRAIKFGFTGGLHLNRWRSLITVAQGLQELKDAGAAVELFIYAPNRDVDKYGLLFASYSVIKEIGTMRPDEVVLELGKFDVLVHVESFLESDSKYTRLSISTKIPQYMSSGRPIFAHGPNTLSSMRYIEANGAGMVVWGEGDVIGVSNTADKLYRSASLRYLYGQCGRNIALTKHNAVTERERFLSVIRKSLS